MPTHDDTPTIAHVNGALGTATPTLPGGELVAGRYEVVGLVGVGGMGSVYRARDRELDELVALKVLRPELVNLPDMLERFRREVKLARRVTHRHVARTFDIGEHGGQKFLTMEFIDGESLARRIGRRGALSPAEVIALGVDICAGLAAAHAAGVLHRDLKPDNVMVAPDGRVVITDFGIARVVDAAQAQAVGVTVGSMLGTPAYMAPEQVEGVEIDARADLYALGAMLFELLTGEPAWVGPSPLAVATARLLRPPPDPRLRRPQVPAALAEVVLRAMARAPDERFASAGELAAALEAAVVGGAAGATSSRTPAGRSPVVPVPGKSIAVLPFRTGGSDDEYLADGLVDDLVDTLSMIPGLRVRPRGVVAQEAGRRDPREIGRVLGVQVVVEGSLRRSGDALHVSTRVISVADGFQLWARRFERRAADVLTVGEEAARAIAAALTVEAASNREVPSDPVALDLYLRGRHLYRDYKVEHITRAAELLAEALRHAPDDPTILSFHALAQARFGAFGSFAVDRQERAREAAERAIALGPNLGAAHLALAAVRFHEERFADAVGELRLALALSPNLVEAHELLGRILIEVGRFEEGIRHNQLALASEPAMNLARGDVARAYGLLGDWERSDAVLVPRDGRDVGTVWSTFARLAMWRRDWDRMRRVVVLATESGSPVAPLLEGILKDPSVAAALLPMDSNVASRRRIFFGQLRAEIAAVSDENPERLLEKMTLAVDAGLIDLGWLERCPLLEGARALPGFASLRSTVVQRIQPILAAIDR